MHHNQFVNITMEMFEKSWSNMDPIRNGITDALCVILWLYETISLEIAQSRRNVHISNFVMFFYRRLLIKFK